MKLTDNELAARVKVGTNFVLRFARNDRQASAKFRDASNLVSWIPQDDDTNENDGGDVPQDVPVGQSNQLTTNIITKLASIALGDPDFHVKSLTQNSENSNLAREFLRSKWKLYNLVRLSMKTAMKRYVAGLGILAYRWDEKFRSVFEHVQSWDLALDPNTRDFRMVKWAARRIKLSQREAVKRYPGAGFPDSAGGDASPDITKVEIWLYYDDEVEAHLWNGKVIERDDNLYGGVPLLFFEGDIDPGTSIWPLSDSALAAGLQAELSDLMLQVSNMAKHGGVINLVDSKRLGSAGMQALESGVQQGFIPVDDLLNPPIHRIEGEQMNGALLEAIRAAQGSLDSITGVNQYQRGVIDQKSNFATEAALVGRQSGARGIQAQTEFEKFVSRMAETMVMLEIAFGGPDHSNLEQHTDEQLILWEALHDVSEVSVLEASTTYKDPASELQQGMQLLNLAAQLFPLFAQTGQPVPALQMYLDDVLRAAGKYDLTRYWMEGQPQQPMGAPQQAGGGDGSLPPGNVPTNGTAPQGGF